jgi:predicted RNA-binding Zn-ribbon protein involved in translation (DUF1610 family)
MRWTKRPENRCASCGYSWYPRGKSRSAECPRCGSPEVLLRFEGCLNALGMLLAAPFLPFIIAARLLMWIISAIVQLLAITLKLACIGLTRIAPPLGRRIGSGAMFAERFALRSFPKIGELTGGIVATIARGCMSSALFLWRWIASAREDLFGEDDREVNPFSLIAKLLAFTVLCSFSLILIIDVLVLAIRSR